MKFVFKILIVLLLLNIAPTFSQVGIGTTSPNADAELDITSTTRGVLLPRVPLSMTTSPAPLSTDVAGMLVYNTNSSGDVTPGVYYNDGSIWIPVGGGAVSNDWALLGNAGTNPATNFVGTTDAQDVVLSRNSSPKIRILNDYTGFTDEIRVRDGSPNGGNNLVIIDDDGGNNRGRIRIYRNNQTQHIIDGQGPTIFNERSHNVDFRIESNTATDGFFLEGSNGQITIGNYGTGAITAGAATQMLAVDTNGNIVEEPLPAGGSTDWAILGNAGTSPATNFVGTTDAQDLSVRRNSIEKVRVNTSETSFMDEIQTRDGAANSGDVLVRLYDSGDDGIIDVYENNTMNHRIHANGESIFNDQQIATADVRFEASGFDDLLFLDAGTAQVSVGDRTPTFIIDTFQSYTYFVGDYAVNGYSEGGAGVYGSDTTDGFGVEGISGITGVGVVGNANGGIPGFFGGSGGSFEGVDYGVYASGTTAGSYGVLANAGTAGLSSFGGDEGVVGNGNLTGITGINPAGTGGFGVLGSADAATGGTAVFALGDMTATGVKPFTIDHPLDPENKKLKHFAIESNEVLNVYRGTANFDTNGNATISLPDYFTAINRNVTYQLTPVGASMPNMYVAKEASNNTFSISEGVAGKKVSWSIFAERNDKYLQTFPERREAEVVKTQKERGKYLDHKAWGQPENKAFFTKKEHISKKEKKQTVRKTKQLAQH